MKWTHTLPSAAGLGGGGLCGGILPPGLPADDVRDLTESLSLPPRCRDPGLPVLVVRPMDAESYAESADLRDGE